MLDAGGLNGCSPMHLAAGWRMQQKVQIIYMCKKSTVNSCNINFENAHNHSRQLTSCNSCDFFINKTIVDSWSSFETIVDSMVNFFDESRLLV